MKKLVLIAALMGMTACTGVTTGKVSDCFGRDESDGSYAVTRNDTMGFTLSTKNYNGGQDDCDFERF